MADRPGYGGSSRLPGRGLSDVADDLVELLDHEGIEKIRVVGYSGGGPHVLALCARYGDRVRAASVVVGAATIEEPDVPLLIGLNAEAYRRMWHDGWPALYELLAWQRATLLDDHQPASGR